MARGRLRPVLPRTSKAPWFVTPPSFHEQPLPLPFWHPLVAKSNWPVALLLKFQAPQSVLLRLVGPDDQEVRRSRSEAHSGNAA
jgi:hypothetical protein